MKKYNEQTSCYKIDLFINLAYVCSTDQSKTCKEAKEKWLRRNKLKEGETLTAEFYKQ